MKTTTIEDVELSKQSSERFHKTLKGEIKDTPEAEAGRNETRIKFAIQHSIDTVQDAFEKIRGTNDLMPITYFQKGLIVAKSVGVIVSDSRRAEGTGFLIAPGLIITNHHVINDSIIAKNWWFKVDYELDLQKQEKASFFFRLRPDKAFFTRSQNYSQQKENLDFTIIGVELVSESNIKSINEYGFLSAFEESGKVKKGEFVSVIQHPNGELKKVAIRENEVVADEHPDFIYYKTDTDHGSSGAPVFNDDWVLVALHHRGIPSAPILADTGIEGEESAPLVLEANEGVRISSILKVLKQNAPEIYSQVLQASNTSQVLPSPSFFEGKSEFSTTNATIPNLKNSNIITEKVNTMSTNTATIILPLEISFKIGRSPLPVSNSQVFIENKLSGEASFEWVPSRFPDYSGRTGYVSNFLKGIEISLEQLLANKQNTLAPLKEPNDQNQFILNYTHYSVAIHRKRKLCLIAAVNIDGSQLVNLNRSGDNWITDIRMDEKYQTGPEVYKNNDLDRGHMVRRLDPVWGSLFEQANDDTFHYTNSCPQHKDLNQKTWLGLEDFVLNNANTNDLKISVFNGPVFSEDDIPYREVLLPLQYWKMVAMVKKDGTPSVTAYLLSQEELLLAGFERVREEFVFGKYKTYQVSLKHIENLTGLVLNPYYQFDPLDQPSGFESTIREIITGSEIKL